MFNRDLPEYKGLTKKDRQILRIPDPPTGIDKSQKAQKERKSIEDKVKGGGQKPEYAP